MKLETSDMAIIILEKRLTVSIVANSINKNRLRGKNRQMNEESASVSLQFDWPPSVRDANP
jgi:hypothetical protein